MGKLGGSEHTGTRIGARRAVFLDRDGVLNQNVWYEDVQAWESPRKPWEFRLVEGMLPALGSLTEAGFLLFLVSNQPNVVNGKSTAEALTAMHRLLADALGSEGIAFTDFFYCRHHPAFSGPCACRKPSPHFLLQAAEDHHLDLRQSWFIGDRVTDMRCGRAAGTRTLWIDTGQEPEQPGSELFDLRCRSLPEAVEALLAAPEAG